MAELPPVEELRQGRDLPELKEPTGVLSLVELALVEEVEEVVVLRGLEARVRPLAFEVPQKQQVRVQPLVLRWGLSVPVSVAWELGLELAWALV